MAILRLKTRIYENVEVETVKPIIKKLQNQGQLFASVSLVAGAFCDVNANFFRIFENK